MLKKKMWRTMGLYKAQFLSMIVLITLGVGIFVGFHMEWVSIEKNVNNLFTQSGFADFRIYSETGFSEADREKMEQIDGVTAAARYLSVTVDVKGEEGDGLALSVTERQEVSGFLLTEGEPYDAESEDGIWLAGQYAEKNGIQLGDSMTFLYRGMEITGRVCGLIKSGEHMVCVRDESQMMPDYSSFGYAYISPAMLKKALGFSFYSQINVLSELKKKEFAERVDEALQVTTLVLGKEENASYAGAEGEIQEGKTMAAILPAVFLLIAMLTMVTTMHRLTAKEKVQIGTLKALGFRDRTILRHYTSYALLIGLIGSALGIGIGYLVAWMILNPNTVMGSYFDLPEWKLYLPWFCVAAVILMILALVLIGYLSVRTMLQGTAADALRPYTPKRMKKLLLERTAVWEKFRFGTRWNLRDILRHKSRSLMSLLGVSSCMLILVAVLGMRDTMDAFLDLYYQKSMNYATRIYVAESAGEEERHALADRYQGDTSGSFSVQLEEKAVALEIYDIQNDKVRFVTDQEEIIALADTGAYVCERISREFGLKEGDSFTVSPYGSEKTYELVVAGVLRSITEGVTMTPAYAEKLGISYRIDSIYTDASRETIENTDAILAVQSKQSIMDSFDSFLQMMNMMIAVFVAAALLLAVVVLYNLGTMSYTERYREMATLKVVGFRDKKIGGLLVEQNAWITVVGMLLGLPLGAWILDTLLQELASEYEMGMKIGPLTYALSILLTFGMSLLVSLRVAAKNRQIDMVEALKSAE